MTDTTAKQRTITLTGRRPVTITEDQWPIIADARWADHDNQYDFQANRTWSARLIVRQHADGRAIVYGIYDYSTVFQGERGRLVKAGEACAAGEDLPSAIQRVGSTLAERSGDPHWSDVIEECIADLPAEEL